jgi:AcrR family transcriptional regulator
MSPRRAKATRGRVGDDPAVALRQHLIDTAEKLLAEKQVGAITTREIARTAGVSDGVLYNYFADKNELIVAALVRRYSRVLERFGSGLPEPGSATVETNLLAYAKATHDLVASALPMAAGLMSEPELLHRFIIEIHKEPMGPHRLRQPIADYLAAEQKLGRLGSFSADAVVSMIMGPAIMLGFTELVAGVPREILAGRLPEVINTLLHGIAP